MAQKEKEIIESLKTINNINKFGYKSIFELEYRIARIMGYKVYTFYNGTFSWDKSEDEERVNKIIKGMEFQNIIKVSKAGTTFKVI